MTYLWLLQLLGQSDAWIPAGLGVDDVTVVDAIQFLSIYIPS